MIVVCHILQYHDNELCRWFNVGVQVFFIISGYLYGGKEISNPIEFIIKQFKKILVPYYIFLAVAIALYFFICPANLALTSIIKSVFCAGTIKGIGHLWFVGYILLCYMITPYLYWQKKYLDSHDLKRKVAAYVFILAMLQILGNIFSSYFLPDRMACYLIGYFMVDIKQTCSLRTKTIIVYSAIVIGIILNVIRAILPLLSLPVSATLVHAYTRYAHLCLGISVFLLLISIFKNAKYNKVLLWSDKYSYPYYLVHGLFILSPLSLLTITSVYPFNLVITITVIAFASMLLQSTSKLLSKEK